MRRGSLVAWEMASNAAGSKSGSSVPARRRRCAKYGSSSSRPRPATFFHEQLSPVVPAPKYNARWRRGDRRTRHDYSVDLALAALIVRENEALSAAHGSLTLRAGVTSTVGSEPSYSSTRRCSAWFWNLVRATPPAQFRTLDGLIGSAFA